MGPGCKPEPPCSTFQVLTKEKSRSDQTPLSGLCVQFSRALTSGVEDPSTSALFLELVHQGDCAESIAQCQEGRDVTHRKSPKARKPLFSQTWSYFKSVRKAGCRDHKGNPFLKQITTSIVVLNPTLTCHLTGLPTADARLLAHIMTLIQGRSLGVKGHFKGMTSFPLGYW